MKSRGRGREPGRGRWLSPSQYNVPGSRFRCSAFPGSAVFRSRVPYFAVSPLRVPPFPATGYRITGCAGIFVDWPWPVSIICNLRSQRLMQSPRCPPGHGPFQARPGGDREDVFFSRKVITGKELRSGSVLPASRCRRGGACVRIVMATRTIRPGVRSKMLCLTRIQAGGKE